MASEKIISAGVFTNEIDQALLPAAVSQIGAAIVGPTVKGPAFKPTKVSSFAEYQEIFGGYTDESYVPFAAAEYLRNGNALTVTRLLPEDGYLLTSGSIALVAVVTASVNRTAAYVSHILSPTVGVNYSTTTALFNSSSYATGSLTAKGATQGALTVSGGFTMDTSLPGVTTFANGLGFTGSISLDPADPNYITKIFGRSPKSTKYPVYVSYESDVDQLVSKFERFHTSSTWNAYIHDVKLHVYNTTSFTQSYQTAATPYITSQRQVGSDKNSVTDLFRFVTLSHGNAANYDVKVGIRDIKISSEVTDPDGYATFTVEVRKVNTNNNPYAVYKSNDTDRTPEVIETFRNVNLNPASPKYIAKVIGDQYETLDTNGVVKFNGDFANKSKYIRVEVTDAVRDRAIDKTLIPFGYKAIYQPFQLGLTYNTALNFTGIKMHETASLRESVIVKSQAIGNSYHKNNYFGFDYSNNHNLNYLAPLATNAVTASYEEPFYLGNYSQDAQANFPSITSPYSGSIHNALSSSTFTQNIALSTRKFMVPFQGGFDGARPNLPKLSGQNTKASNTFGFDCSSLSSAGTKLYQKAFDVLSNVDYYDLNMLITPGIYSDSQLHPHVATAARNLCLDRQDSFYIMDTHPYKYNGADVSVQDVIDSVVELDNNYTATYWPWVKINNPDTNTPLWAPPSVVVPGALTFNDRVSAPWFAPAGLNRGGLGSVSQTYQVLTQADRNSLYDARINPIANFPNDGIVIWGQKTLQGYPSALDRVNVRRLLITVKKFIASATKYLVFDQNNEVTRSKFLNIVNPYLESVRVQQGLSAFKVVMDNTNNTVDMLDQGILYGQLFLQPTRTAEFIVLDFNIQPTGASFPE